jgi:D-alanine-D-alanine ligase
MIPVSMAEKIKIALLFGGRSAEHEVSLSSAAAVYTHLDKKKYSVISIFIDKEGNWRSVESPDLPGEELNKGRVLSFLPWEGEGSDRILRPDIIFPVLHGPYGEDGTVQGVCELADVPYVGAGVLSSAMCMDKDVAKSLFRSNGLPVVDYLTVHEWEWEQEKEDILGRIMEKFRLPFFVKPANLGSSVGITKAKEPQELGRALELAFQFDQKVMVEEGIVGRELECSVIGNNEPEASLPGELIPYREFYDYRDKYVEGKTTFIIPAKVSPQIIETIQETAVRAFKVLECSGMARVDFFLEDVTERILLNEINTIPGFTEISMYPKMWESSGISFPELLDKLVMLGFERYENGKRKGTNHLQ